MQETWVQAVGQEDPLEKEIATHSSILAWELLQTEEPGRLQSKGVTKVGHDLATKQQSPPLSAEDPRGFFPLLPRWSC